MSADLRCFDCLTAGRLDRTYRPIPLAVTFLSGTALCENHAIKRTLEGDHHQKGTTP